MLTPEAAATAAIRSFVVDPLTPDQISARDSINDILSSPDPHIDLPTLFTHYSTLYFRSLLPSSVCTVLWSTKMTLCARTCTLLHSKGPSPRPLFPRQTEIRLSEPLLKFRSRSDILATLLHEGIHAYLFVSSDHRRSEDASGHGIDFQMLAGSINEHGGYDITVAHEFHDEVESYRKHVWKCDGPCQERPPYFGLVKRAMNRAPGSSDDWWERHQEECGGRFKKIAGPGDWGAMDKWIDKTPIKEAKTPKRGGSCRKRKLGDEWQAETPTRGSSAKREMGIDAWVVRTPTSTPGKSAKRRTMMMDEGALTDQPDEVSTPSKRQSRLLFQPKINMEPEVRLNDSLVDCPVDECPERIPEAGINQHLDKMHGFC